MSFTDEAGVMLVTEDVLRAAFDAAGLELSTPFRRMTYNDALTRYAAQRPPRPLRLCRASWNHSSASVCSMRGA